VKTLLDIVNLKKHYHVKRGFWQRTVGTIKAVDDISLQLNRGETVGLVGESGCGKTTVAKTIVQLSKPTAGHIVFNGLELNNLSTKELVKIRPRLQMIFQDPYASLNPRMNTGRIINEPMTEHTLMSGVERKSRVDELMSIVGLDNELISRYPHELSGGQRQRIGIARAIVLNPDLIICDEPVSALDVSIQAQIVNLLEDIQDKFGLTYLFISHDLGMIKHLCTRVAVMYLGQIVELGNKEDLYEHPQHPYTKALIAAAPQLHLRTRHSRERVLLSGEIPNPEEPPTGCRFHTRCPYVEPRCREQQPELRELGEGYYVSCHLI